MQLHTLGSISSKKSKRRVARGGKRGTTSGRGQKGQKSRAGRRIRPAIRDLIIRIPKRRGFRNKTKSLSAHAIAVALLARKAAPRAQGKAPIVVTLNVLREMKLVPLRLIKPVKLVGGGTLTCALAVRGIAVSASARTAIEKAGGSVT